MLTWSEDLELKIEIIDSQHQKIFEVINGLITAFDEHNEVEKAYEALCFIEEYVKKHFQTEEFYLKKYNYHEYESHLKLHESFSTHLNEFKVSCRRSGITRKAAIEMSDFLTSWWYNHILTVDIKYVSWISERIDSIV